jgi:peptidoglycan biosynthesis protein MviN/MurJ (putative lipid II flippase)
MMTASPNPIPIASSLPGSRSKEPHGGAVPVAEARAGMAMSVATFAMAAASAIQAVLYLSSFGTSGRTDGFFVAFALYTTFGVFSQSLRLTAVPLLVEPGARLTVLQFAGVLAVIGVPVLIVTGPLAPTLAAVLAPGLDPADRAVTESALPILGVATVAQLWAAGGATVLAVRARFMSVASAYIAGAAAGLATYLALMDVAGELTLGWSMLAMALVTLAWMMGAVRASGGFGPRRGLSAPRLVADSGLVLGRTVIYLAFNLLFLVTLSFASHSAVGDATVLSYAYLFASYLVAGTGMALGMSRIPDMTRGARAEQRRVVQETVPQGFRYAMLLVSPLLAALIAVGAPAIHVVLPASLNADGVAALRTFAALLVPWTVAAMAVSFLLPAMLALGRARLVNLLAAPLVAVHVAATAIGSALFGVEGAVGAFFIAPLAFAVVLLAAGADDGRIAWAIGREMAGDALRFLGLGAAAFGIGLAIAAPLGELAGVLVAGVCGGVLYAAGLWLFARQQIGVMVRAVRPAET